MNYIIKSFKKTIVIFMAILCFIGSTLLTTIQAISLEETNIVIAEPKKITEYKLIPIEFKPIPVLLEYFTYEEPASIEEAEINIKNINNYIETLQYKIKNECVIFYTSPATMVILNEVRSMQELITQYECFIIEAQKAPPYTLIDLGEFKLTAYCPCKECSGPWGSMTSTGIQAQINYTVAVDPKVIPYGTKLYINGNIYEAQDCGGVVKGNVIDIYFATHAETEQFGVKYTQIYQYQE